MENIYNRALFQSYKTHISSCMISSSIPSYPFTHWPTLRLSTFIAYIFHLLENGTHVAYWWPIYHSLFLVYTIMSVVLS